MRNISSNGLAKLAQKLGTEPICIISVDWAGIPKLYADRDVLGIPGKIIDLGALDNVTNISGSGGSQELSVTLDDTDGEIKAIFDTHDIHLRVAKVYQYFNGLDISDKFLLFTGTVSSPLTWNERDRTVKFSIISRLESNEVGFSAEEGNFPYLPADLVGKVWPTVFGKVQNVPALQVPQAVSGTTLNGIGCIAGIDSWANAPLGDDTSAFFDSLALSFIQEGHYNKVAGAWLGVDDVKVQEALDQYTSISEQIAQAVGQYIKQQACANASKAQAIADAVRDGDGGDTIQILGGEDFPQSQTITLNINGGWFTGVFNGNLFTIFSRMQSDLELQAQMIAAQRQVSCNNPATPAQKYLFQSDVPCGSGNTNNSCVYTTQGTLISTRSATSHEMPTRPIGQQFWADAGASVYILGQEPKTYIVSTTPGTVLSVKAYRKFNGGQTLIEVPSTYYSVVSQNYGPVTAVQIVLNQLLSTIIDPIDGINYWSDNLYVTFESTIGPNIVDIIKYLITNHTDLTWDGSTGPTGPSDPGPTGPSFDHCYNKLAQFPANFALLDRKDVLQVLSDIAFQSRCAIWLDDDVFKMKYLPEVPTPIDTITVSDIDAENGIEISLTPTENLITRMNVTWRMSLASFILGQSPDLIMILRHNVAKYSLLEQSYDWYIFNQPDIIYKMATFWLIRNSITWKTLKFQTYLNKLNLETFDAVTLDLPQVATGPVTAIITKASYNSVDNVVDIECALPIEAGSMIPNSFYWPASLAQTVTWPSQADIDNGNAGGGQYSNATGSLPIGDTSTVTIPGEQVIIVGGPNVVFTAHSGWGDRTPTDVGFTSQTMINPAVYTGLSTRVRPSLYLETRVPRKMDPLKIVSESAGFSIDIHKTKITDSSFKGRVAYFDSIIEAINSSDKLVLAGDTMLVAADGQSADNAKIFDFKFDGAGDKMGAGTAFLQD